MEGSTQMDKNKFVVIRTAGNPVGFNGVLGVFDELKFAQNACNADMVIVLRNVESISLKWAWGSDYTTAHPEHWQSAKVADCTVIYRIYEAPANGVFQSYNYRQPTENEEPPAND